MWLGKQDDVAALMPWQLRGVKAPVFKDEHGATPDAITDLEMNLKNRQHAIDDYLYGPMNPNAPGDYWQRLGDVWGVGAEEAASTRCGNCAAFNQKPEILDAIADGISSEGVEVTGAADLGYCELFQFKCAAARSCSAWLTGGPLTGSGPTDEYMLKHLVGQHDQSDHDVRAGGSGADVDKEVEKQEECSCWEGYERVPGTKPCESDSCRKK